MKPLFGISEVDDKGELCFWVRLGWKDKKPRVSKRFGFKKNRGRKEALSKATAYRDKELSRLKKLKLYPPTRERIKLPSNNKSGVVGVHRSRQSNRYGSLNCYCWTATWSINGKVHTACFGETKWGELEAFEMACACRKAKRNIYA